LPLWRHRIQATVDEFAQGYSGGLVGEVADGGVADRLFKSPEQIESLATHHGGRRVGKRNLGPLLFGVGEQRGANGVVGYAFKASRARLGLEKIPAALQLRMRDDLACV
jgi:hypothetical protein